MQKVLRNWFGSGGNSRSAGVHGSSATAGNPAPQSAVTVTLKELISLRQAARHISLKSTYVKNSSITGMHPSRFRGRGMDYQESRVYQAGDDVRSMDWRVTARAGVPYVKLYEEERQRPVMLLVDLNPGMFFASQGAFKSVIAARAAALIAWAGVAQGDRVGGLIFNGDHLEIPPRGSATGALQLFRLLVQAADPEKGLQESRPGADNNDLDSALKRCRRVTKPGSLVFILSDFYHLGEETNAQLLRLGQHNDLVAVQIVDPLEIMPPPTGVYGVSNGVQHGVIDTRTQDLKQGYEQWCAAHHAEVEQVMRRCAIPLLKLSTTDEPAMVLQQSLADGKKRNPSMRINRVMS
jgi:uncharacterized protein (DUF58 family)